MSKVRNAAITAIATVLVLLGGKDQILDFVSNGFNQETENTAESTKKTTKKSDVDVTDYSNTAVTVNGSAIPAYSGTPYVEVNNNEPYFLDEEITNVTYVTFSELDNLQRQGVANAVLGPETLQYHERGSISNFHPSGWWEAKESDINVNRCHLIGNQLGGDQTDCLQNLVTGTRYLNVDGMLPFENEVDDYIENTANHVRYRVTPIFVEDDVTCKGVLMEAQSVEDSDLKFCVYCYNVDPNYVCDYSIGKWARQ